MARPIVGPTGPTVVMNDEAVPNEAARVPAPGPRSGGDDALEVDCGTCAVRGIGCSDCVVSFLLGPPNEILTVDRDQVRALRVLAGGGLVPPLRHRTARRA